MKLAAMAVGGLVFALTASSAVADVVYKKDGGKLRGKVDLAASGGTEVVITTPFGTFRVPKLQISKVELDPAENGPGPAPAEPAAAPAPPATPDPDEAKAASPAAPSKTKAEIAATEPEYQARLKTAGESAEAHFDLALWCLEAGRKDNYRQHLEKVIALEPDHPDARIRLGFQKHNGTWMTRDQAMEAQGYVKHMGRWMLPQEKELAEAKAQATETVKQYYRDIRTWQRGLRVSDPAKQQEARAALMALADPLAVEPLTKLLGEKGEDWERGLLAEILADIPGDAAEQTLMTLALLDGSVTVRGVAVEVVTGRKTPALLAQAAAALRHEHNFVVQNAGVLLGSIGDESVIPQLVEALVTTHRYEKELNVLEQFQARQAASSFKATETTFLPDGTMVRRSNLPNSFGQGGSRVNVGPNQDRIVRVETVQNVTVLAALAKITGVNHGFDKEAWISWLQNNDRSRGARVGS